MLCDVARDIGNMVYILPVKIANKIRLTLFKLFFSDEVLFISSDYCRKRMVSVFGLCKNQTQDLHYEIIIHENAVFQRKTIITHLIKILKDKRSRGQFLCYLKYTDLIFFQTQYLTII